MMESDATMTGPQIIRPAHIETLRCADPRAGWRGCDPANISLGRWDDGRWSMAVSAQVSGIGRGRPMSEWSDGRPMVRYASRTEALDAAVAELLELARGWARLAPGGEVSRIADWAASQRTQQGDLFGMAA